MKERFSNRCRACAGLQECSEKMISLFEKKLSEMFTNCTSLEVASNDSLPSHICLDCFGCLSNFNKFRQNCVNSDTFLREQIVSESIKVEPFDEIDIKYEENEPIPEVECEFFKPEIIDDFSQYEPDSIANPITSNDNIKATNVFDNTKYICDYCDQQFDMKSHVGSHMVKHRNYFLGRKPKPTINFPCTVKKCNKIFDKKRSLNNHLRHVHKIKAEPSVNSVGEKKVTLSCHRCPKRFTTQLKLDAHIRGEHEGLKPYKCPHPDCEKEFCKSRSYVHHLQFRHCTAAEKKKYRCTYGKCDREFNLAESLRVHINKLHLGRIPERSNQRLICEQCGQSFSNGWTLKEHSYTHSGVKAFTCKICSKTFKSNSRLKAHSIRHVSVKPFVCPHCGQRKTTNKELQAHLNFHSKEITYPCKECPRVFTSSGAISRHVRIHHRNHKPYICPHCQRAFAKAETMKNHVMTHTGEKPFACSECGHRFIQSVALKAHMKVHTKKLSS